LDLNEKQIAQQCCNILNSNNALSMRSNDIMDDQSSLFYKLMKSYIDWLELDFRFDPMLYEYSTRYKLFDKLNTISCVGFMPLENRISQKATTRVIALTRYTQELMRKMPTE